MSNFNRPDWELRYNIFDKFALKDQKNYYLKVVANNRIASMQVIQLRALFAFLTGFSAALAGLIVQTTFVDSATCGSIAAEAGTLPSFCTGMKAFTMLLAIFAVVFPAVGTMFSSLSDLYQWDKLNDIYKVSLENLELADTLSPSDNIPESESSIYEASVRAFVAGTLDVMADESSQWGQSIRTPEAMEKFVEEAKAKSAAASSGSVDLPS